MTESPRPSRKPYVAPRIVEQGKVSTVTRQLTPTPTITPTPIGSALGSEFVDEF